MTYTKPLLAGAAIFLAGYCTGTCTRKEEAGTRTSKPETTLETKTEPNQKNKNTLIDFLKQNQGKAPPQKHQQKDYFQTFWDNLPEKTKTDLIKHVVTTQLKKYYEGAKQQSTTMYEELKHYFNKKLEKEK